MVFRNFSSIRKCNKPDFKIRKLRMISFIFGKKRPPPEVYVAEETPEGFMPVIATTPPYESPLPPYPPLPRSDTAGYPYVPPSPYPPQASPYPPVSPQVSHYAPASPYTPTSPYRAQSSLPSNPLDSIPFVLAPALTIARTRFSSDVGSIKNQMNQLKDRLATNYNYDFSLERSVIQDYSN